MHIFKIDNYIKIQFYNKSKIILNQRTMHQSHKILQQQKNKIKRDSSKLDEEFLTYITRIQRNFQLITKHQKVRVNAWLKKLNITIDNIVWKQNRNLYIKVLYQMITQKNILEPFHKCPPQGPLQRLTNFDIAYPFRDKFMLQTDGLRKSCSKFKGSNGRDSFSSGVNQIWSEKQNLELNTCLKSPHNNYSRKAHKKNQSLILNQDLNSSNTRKITFNQIFNSTQKTYFPIKKQSITKKLFNDQYNVSHKQQDRNVNLSSSMKSHNEQIVQNKLFGLLKRSLKFLAKNCDLLQDQIEYKTIISEIIKAGDERKIDLRNVDITPSPGKVVFKKYNDRIKQKFEKTDEESKQFMQYLSIVKNK